MDVKNRVYFIGAGPGDPELITVKGQRLIQQADLVLYAGSLVPRAIVDKADPKARVIDSSDLTLQKTHALIQKTVKDQGLVARVHTGDPSLYGAIKEQMILLERDGIPYEVIPGVTAACATAAAAGVSFTLPEKTQTLILTRAEGRTAVPDSERLESLGRHGCSLAIYLSASRTKDIVNQLNAAGYDQNTPVIVGYQVGWTGERIIPTRLFELEDCIQKEQITRQAVFLILPGQDEEPVFSKLYSAEFEHSFRSVQF